MVPRNSSAHSLTRACACPGQEKTYRYIGRLVAEPLVATPLAGSIFSRKSRGHTWNRSSSFLLDQVLFKMVSAF